MKWFKLLALAGLLLAPAIKSAAEHDIYPDPSQAKTDIAAALKTAAAQHKRVLLDFGGNWCGDCIVLDLYMHNEQNEPILNAGFVLVHVNVGKYDANDDLAKKYKIPLGKGVPAVAVLSADGRLLYSQQGGEFEGMRRMRASSVTTFLTQWKPKAKGCSVVTVSC